MRHLTISLFFSLLLWSVGATAQQPATPPQDTSGPRKVVFIEHSDRLGQKNTDTASYKIAAGNVKMTQDNTIFYCDSVVINQTTNILQAFGHVHINDHDSVHTYSDYLRYLIKEKKAFLKDNVRLTDGKGTLVTPTLDYDMNTKTGVYTQGGTLTSGKTVLTSREGYYYGETRDALFKKKVVLNDSGTIVKTDTLWFNTYSRKATFTVLTDITSQTTHITTTDGYYDFNTKHSYFAKRSPIRDGSSILIADEVASDDSTGFGEARGDVIFKDTAQGITLLANNIKTNKKEGAILATEKPVAIIKQGNDSTFLAADTLYSAKLSALIQTRYVPNVRDSGLLNDSIKEIKMLPDSSNDRFIEAYFHVRIFSDSMQAVGDSLFYSLADSTFRLFREPIIWAQQSQITGDTIYIFTANNKPQRMYAFENSLVINKVNKSNNFFNQVRGRTMNAYFNKEGNIDYTHTKGSQAEYIYYAVDEKNRYIGVDKSSSDVINIYFVNKEPNEVKLINDVKGTMSPMGQVDHENMKLRGFQWQENRRPKTKYELFGN